MPFSYGIEALEPAFEDRPIPYIAFGARFDELAAIHLSQTLGAERVFLIVSRSLSTNTDAAKRLENAIRHKTQTKLVGIQVGISPHTPATEVLAVTSKVRNAFTANGGTISDRDVIVTLGGGSIIDGTKVIAWLLSNPEVASMSAFDELQQASKMVATGEPATTRYNAPVVRVITIATTLSGGEYSIGAGVTFPSGEKRGIVPPMRNPSLLILDPDLATATPSKYWLSSGVRAIDHCVETLCSLQSNDKANAAAADGLTKLIPSLLQTKAHSHDLDARFDSMMGVKDAMVALADHIPLGASHAIGHQLGPLGVGHGETSCIMLPAVCAWNLKYHANTDQQEKCRQIISSIPEVRSLLASADKPDDASLADILDAVIRALGMPRRLADVGVGRDKLDRLAQNTLGDPWAKSNPKPLKTKQEVLEILEMVI